MTSIDHSYDNTTDESAFTDQDVDKSKLGMGPPFIHLWLQPINGQTKNKRMTKTDQWSFNF